MNDIQIFAFVILPVVVASLGWLLAGLTVRAARRNRAHRKARAAE
jgi:hypothetical protein